MKTNGGVEVELCIFWNCEQNTGGWSAPWIWEQHWQKGRFM